MLKTLTPRLCVLVAIAALSIPMAIQAVGPAGGDDEVVLYDHPDYSTLRIEGRGGAAKVDFFLIVRGGEDNVHARQVTEFVAGAVDAEGMLVRDAILKIKFGDGTETDLDIDRRTRFEHVWKEPGKYKVSFKLSSREGTVLARAHTRLKVRNRLRTNLQIVGDADISPDEDVRFRFVATLEEARAVRGELTVNWDDGYSDIIKKFDGDASRTHNYSREGVYRITVTLRPESGKKVQVREKAVTVREVSTMTLANAQIAGNSAQNIASFRVTSDVTSVSVTPGQICIFHTKAGGWPVKNALEGNPWVAANVNGRLNAGTFEWLRPGQVCKSIDVPGKYRNTAVSLGPHVKNGPLAGWVPKKGETVWFFVSTHARLGSTTTNERAEPVAVVWPY